MTTSPTSEQTQTPTRPAEGRIETHTDPADAPITLPETGGLAELIRPPRIPRATYRFQFGPTFTFAHARDLVAYLDDLNVSDLYASPIFKPRTGSTHGYDTVDHNQFNPALGGAEGFEALSAELRAHGMGLILDLVPNHMGVNTENRWWFEVLKHGPSSEHGRYFDIDWHPDSPLLEDKVLVPVLGEQYGRVLEAGALELVYWHGDFYVHYYEHQFPVTPESYGLILECVLDKLPPPTDDATQWAQIETASVIHSLRFLPGYRVRDAEERQTRQREEMIIRWRLLGLYDKSEPFRAALHQALDEINGTPGDSASFDLLDTLLDQQPYRLAFWRTATDTINYRRFFDINDMIALRVEDPFVFEETHRLAMRLLAEGKANGVRIDHPDGLWDPTAYFWRLQTTYLKTAFHMRTGIQADEPLLIEAGLGALRDMQPPRDTDWPLYVLVEKILSSSEPLPDSWAVYGTTGYDFLFASNNLFVNQANEEALTAIYSHFIGENVDFHDLTQRTKKAVMSQALMSELDARSGELAEIVAGNRRYRGFTQNSLALAMSEIIAALDVYRTYITGPDNVSERDCRYLEAAVKVARKRNPLIAGDIFDFIRDVLLMENLKEFAAEQQQALRTFVMKFQQITGPIMAKGVEDTAFYLYNRLVSLNEVGGHPNQFGIDVQSFHDHFVDFPYPHSMNSTGTHDTKRSDGVRARINVLSDMPEEWEEAVTAWAEMNEMHKTTVNDLLAPSTNDEYLLYQTLVGTAVSEPNVQDDEIYLSRVVAYMRKAVNEGKTYSNWVNPQEEYLQATESFLRGIWGSTQFRASFVPLQRRVSFFGHFDGLSQTLLKLVCPGVPDIYQGAELWDYSMVDPDNRRPVDYSKRRALLANIRAKEGQNRVALAAELLGRAETGEIKLYTIYRALGLRRAHEDLFAHGTYVPLEVRGAKAEHVVAFLRQHGGLTVLAVVPRLIVSLVGGAEHAPMGKAIWGETQIVLPADLPAGAWENVFTGAQVAPGRAQNGRPQQGAPAVPVADLLDSFPVGLFVLRAE